MVWRFLLYVPCVCCLYVSSFAAETVRVSGTSEAPQFFSPPVASTALLSLSAAYTPQGPDVNNAAVIEETLLRGYFTVYSPNGLEVRTLSTQVSAAGANGQATLATATLVVAWDGRDDAGNLLPDGVYTYTAYAALIQLHQLKKGKNTAPQEIVKASSATVAGTNPIVLDATPPLIGAVAPLTYSRTSTPTVSASLSDNLSGVDPASVQLLINGSLVPATVSPAGVSFTTGPLPDGPHTALLMASDRAKNQATAAWSFFIDTVPPTAALSPPRNSFTNKARPTFSATYSDPAPSSGINAEGIVATLDNVIVTNLLTPNPDPLSAFAFTPSSDLAEGTHVFAAMIPDNAGNSVTVSTSIAVDLTPPTVSGILPINGSYVTANRPLIAANYSDNLSGVNLQSIAVTLDGPSISVTKTATGFTYIPPANLTQGDHLVALQLADIAGNTQAATWTFTLDSLPPVISNLVPANGTRTSVQRPAFSGSFADTGSGPNPATFALSLDGTDVTADAQLTYTGAALSGFTYQPTTPLSESNHALTVSIADFAGNTAFATTNVVIDITPPAPPVADTITIDATTATFIGSTEPDVVSIIANIDGAQLDYAKIGSWSAHVTKTTNDTFTLTVQLVDSAGNVSLPSTFVETFLTQTNPITITKFEALQPKLVENSIFYFNQTQVDFVAEASGGQGPLTVTIGDQSGANNANQFTGTLTLPEGQNQVTATVTDASGNSQSSTITVVVDITPPVLTLDTLTDNSGDTDQTPITQLTTAPLGFLYLNGLGSGKSVRQDSTLPRNVFSAGNFGIQAEVTDALSGVGTSIHVDVREIDALSGDTTYPYVDYASALDSGQLNLTTILSQPTLSPQSQDFSVTAAPVQGGDQNRVTFTAASIAQGLKDSARKENNVDLSKIYFYTITATDKVGNTTTLNFWAKVDTVAPTKVEKYLQYPIQPAMAGVFTDEPDVVKVGDSGTPSLQRAYANGPWLFPVQANTVHLTLEDIAGNRSGIVEVDYNPIVQPIARINGQISYYFDNPCAPSIPPYNIVPPLSRLSVPIPIYLGNTTFSATYTFDNNNYVEVKPSWDSSQRLHDVVIDSPNPFVHLDTPQTGVVQSFVIGGLPDVGRPSPYNDTVPAPPSPTIQSTSGDIHSSYSQSVDQGGPLLPGWNPLRGVSYSSSWALYSELIEDKGACISKQFADEAIVDQQWEAGEQYFTPGIELDRKVVAFQVTPDTVAANAGNHVYIRGYFGDNYKIGDMVPVTFKANGGSGAVMIISDPKLPASAEGYGHIVDDDIQNFTAVQTLDVALGDSTNVSGVFDVNVNGVVLPRTIRFFTIEFMTRDSSGNLIRQGFTFNSLPQPELSASITNPKISDDETALVFNIAGTVSDPASGCVADPSLQLQNLVVRSNGSPDLNVALNNGGMPDLPFKPYNYLASFSTTVTIPIKGEGDYQSRILTLPNAAGVPLNCIIPIKIIDQKQLYSIDLPGGLNTSLIDAMSFYMGDTPPVPLQILQETEAASNTFEGLLSSGDTQITLLSIAGDEPDLNGFQAHVLVANGQNIVDEFDLLFTETPVGSLHYVALRDLGLGVNMRAQINTSNQWTDFLPTIIRINDPAGVLVSPVTVTALGRVWNTSAANYGDGNYLYARDDGGSPLVILPTAGETKSDIANVKPLTPGNFAVQIHDKSGNVKPLGSISVVQGIVVYNESAKTDIDAVLNDCDEIKAPLGTATCYCYAPGVDKDKKGNYLFNHKDDSVRTEIYWRFVSSANKVYFFESKQELDNDIAFRLNVIANAPLWKVAFGGSKTFHLSNSFWVDPAPRFDLPYTYRGNSVEASLNDLWASPQNYTVACEDAALLILAHGAANVLKGDLDTLLAKVQKSLGKGEDGFRKSFYSPDPFSSQDPNLPDSNTYYWIPGDWGVIDDNQDNIPNDNLNGCENVIYLGAGGGKGCFNAGEKFNQTAMFFGHVPTNLAPNVKTLQGWLDKVATYGGTPKKPVGNAKPPPLSVVNKIRYSLKQPLGF